MARFPKRQLGIAFLVGITILAIASMVWDAFNEDAPARQMAALDVALREVVAAETVRAGGNSGSVVVVTADGPQTDKQMEAFQAALASRGGMKLGAVEKLDRMKFERMSSPGTIPFAEFERLVKQHRDAAAVVTFLGLPEFEPGELEKLTEPLPPIVAISTSGLGVREMLGKGKRVTVIAPRKSSAGSGNGSPPPPEPRDPALKKISSWDLFNARYQILVPGSDLSGLHEAPSLKHPPMRPPGPGMPPPPGTPHPVAPPGNPVGDGKKH